MNAENFIDHVRICCRSGKGGDGAVHFRREKHVPKGGPDGGDGGRGGHVILRGNKQLWTLLHLRYRKHVIAEKGQPGMGGGKTGKQGKDEVVEVPVGTVATEADTGRVRFEILEDGQEVILTPGGSGGKGNIHYKSSVQQAPRQAQPGGESLEEWIVLELKLLADVGMVGFPNAGKSTLLSVLSAAKPEIADYSFTTTAPNLGVVAYREDRSFVMADLPGIISGAAEGKGLGHRFLRHIERNAVLLFMVSSENLEVGQQYQTLLRELEAFNPEMLQKKRVLAITKADLLDEELQQEIEKQLPAELPHVFISAHTEKGLTNLKDLLWQHIVEQMPPETSW